MSTAGEELDRLQFERELGRFLIGFLAVLVGLVILVGGLCIWIAW